MKTKSAHLEELNKLGEEIQEHQEWITVTLDDIKLLESIREEDGTPPNAVQRKLKEIQKLVTEHETRIQEISTVQDNLRAEMSKGESATTLERINHIMTTIANGLNQEARRRMSMARSEKDDDAALSL